MSKIYKIQDNKIYITNSSDFNIKHICECGQMFRYYVEGEKYTIISSFERAVISPLNGGYEIECSNVDYFISYFDLDTDYSAIKKSLCGEIMTKAVNYGYGIRILKQDLFEMIISFILSANNNIKRIQKSLEYICINCGEKRDGYYAFPTLEKLSECNEEFFKKAGAGYRASYLVSTIKTLLTYPLQNLPTLSTSEARKELMSFKGIGRKVADCILLFGLARQDVFPVDTWIEKVYKDYFYEGEKTREDISKFLTDKFGVLSGYAQQYIFYYRRTNEK